MSIFKKIGEKLVGVEGLIIWERSEENNSRNLVYRIPNDKISDMRRVEKFGVRDFERALLFNSGQLTSILEGGVYEIDKNHRNSATEIVFVDNGIFELSWGVPHFQSMLTTSELIKVGMNGTLKLKVVDHGAFIQKVVAYRKDYSDQIVKEFITSLLTTSLRDIVKKFTLKNLVQSNREDIKALTVTKVSQEFRLYGLELISNDILGFAFSSEDQLQVDEILNETLDDIAKLREEKDRLTLSIIDVKKQLETLENDYTSGKIDDEDYEKREARILKIKTKREEDLKLIQTKLNSITKQQGIQN
jgi:membrane protease subunit (stomatin/prohibitin family)